MKDGMGLHLIVNVSSRHHSSSNMLIYNCFNFHVAVRCSPPGDIANGGFTVSNKELIFGTIVEYSCKNGYKMVGSRTLTCLANGQYDVVPPVCQGIFIAISNCC